MVCSPMFHVEAKKLFHFLFSQYILTINICMCAFMQKIKMLDEDGDKD